MITFLIIRARRNWQVLSTVFLGVLISTVLLASGPIVVDTVIAFALPHKLRSSFEQNGTIFLKTYNNQGQTGRDQLDTFIQDLLISNINELDEIVSISISPWLFPWQSDSLVTDERINIRALTGIDEHIKFDSGNWPVKTIDAGKVQAIFPKSVADAYALQIGDNLPASKSTKEEKPTILLEVAGIYQSLEASDPYWLIEEIPNQSQENSKFIAENGVIVREEDYYTIAEELFPGTNHQLIWMGIVNPGEINPNKLEGVIDGIENIRAKIVSSQNKVILETNLDEFLSKYKYQAAEIIPPIYLVIGEVLLLGLYYVVMVATLSIRHIEGELSTLASRGASLGQLLRLQIFDSLLVCSTAFIIGPLLSIGVIKSLAIIGPIADINQIDWITRILPASWIAAGVSVIACFTVQIFLALPILRRSIVDHQQRATRREGSAWWHRYNLDILLLIIGLIAVWRFSQYGSISGITVGKVDWLLLLGPLLLLLGAAALMLRIFPLFFRLIARFVSKGRGLIGVLALWNTSRDPTQATRLILLFTLTIALGILATGLNATLSLSELERARYSTGGEVRFSFDSFIPQSSLDNFTQVTNTSTIWRGKGRANVRSYRNIPNFSILAIEPISFASVTQFRNDYSDDYIGFVLGQLIVNPDQLPVSLIPLPKKPSNIGFWIADPFPARTDVDLLDFVDIRIKLQSSEGEIVMLDLDQDPGFLLQSQSSPGNENPKDPAVYKDQLIALSSHQLENQEINEPQWRYFEAKFPQYAEQGYPLSLHSIWIKIRPLPSDEGSRLYSPGPLIIDDLSVQFSNQDLEIFEDFEQLKTIWQTRDALSVASYTKSDISRSGQASMRLYFGPSNSSNWLVLSPAQTTRINFIPVLASPTFLEMTGIKVGDKFAAFIGGISLMLEVKNSVNYFPTMYDMLDNGYLILSRDALLVELNKSSRIPINANEIWLRVDENQKRIDLREVIPQIKRLWEIETERILFKADPLTLGLRSVIFLAYSLTLLLSLVGFATLLYLSARKRISYYGILRSLGLSTTQLYGSLVLEQLILFISGLSLGIILGSLLNKIVLPGLPISYADMPAIPPFLPQEDWYSVIRFVLVILGGFLITLAFATFMLWRIKLHQTLRIGEE